MYYFTLVIFKFQAKVLDFILNQYFSNKNLNFCIVNLIILTKWNNFSVINPNVEFNNYFKFLLYYFIC